MDVGQRSNLNTSEQSLVAGQQGTSRLSMNLENVHCSELPIQQRIEWQSARTPDAIAIECDTCALSYAELNTRANRLAHYLQKRGVGLDTLVGLCLTNSLTSVIACLGILKAGGAYVPLDPQSPPERLRFMLQDAQLDVLLTDKASIIDEGYGVAHMLLLNAHWSVLASESADDPPWRGSELNNAYMIYTSGSTGQPKGVQIAHSSLKNLINWHLTHFQVTESDNATLFASFAFDASVWGIWPYLAAGARLCLPPASEHSLHQIQDWFIERGVTIAFLPTPLAERMLFLPWPAALPLRYLLTGGDRLHHYPERELPFVVVNNYGPTENTVVATSCFLDAQERPDAQPPIGWPISHSQVYILDQRLQAMPVGEAGELYIGGNNLARGYHHLPALTAASFCPDPFSSEPGSRLYRTGDLACYLQNGMLKFIDRADRQVKLRGYRFELGEVEAALSTYPGIEACAVVLHHKGSANPLLYAYIVWQQEAMVEQERVQAYLKQKVPPYMVPVQYVSMPELPLTTNGKIYYERLPLPAQPQHEMLPAEEAMSELERALCETWRQILGLERVGLHDDFFIMGGHSLSVVQFIAHVRASYNVNLLVLDIFMAPTVQQIAGVIQSKIV
ncbi:non-ribosomal peptide synthetase [Dictyobacter alpinus]|nr:non-ribosomal peptide synthetase [Dictyobacter alpinus]